MAEVKKNVTTSNSPTVKAQPVKRTPEMKAADFKRLAVKRVTKAIKMLRVIGNLANKSAYSFTEEQATKILNALITEVKTLQDKFNGSKEDNHKFTL